MRKKLFVLSVLILVFAVTIVPTFSQQQGSSQNDVVEQFGDGYIDYTNGWIYAKGQAPIRPDKDQGPTLAAAVAVDEGKRKLAEVAKGITISGDRRIERVIAQNYNLQVRLNEVVVYGQQVGDTTYTVVGARTQEEVAIVKVRMPLKMLPKEIFDEIFPQTRLAPPVVPAAPEQPSSPQTQESPIYSGVVINAANLRIRPAMAPKILDEDGREVYGSAYVDRNWAINHGMTGYTKSIDDALRNERVIKNPLRVTGIKASNDTDIVISNADANKIRNASSYQKFLDECRVMIVLG